MKKLVAACCSCSCASPAFAQDVSCGSRPTATRWTMTDQSQPARDDVAEQWFSAGKTAQNGKATGFIVDLDKRWPT